MNDAPKPHKVSAETEQRLRGAMSRLLSGCGTITDGRLTKNNLHREAGVSRATMNRATRILDEWNAAVESPQPWDTELTTRDDTIKELRAALTKLRTEIADLEAKVVAATTIIASLHQENQELRGTEIAANLSALRPRSQARKLHR